MHVFWSIRKEIASFLAGMKSDDKRVFSLVKKKFDVVAFF